MNLETLSAMPDYKSTREKAERTAAVAAEVINAERQAREMKTARLRALRLEANVPGKASQKFAAACLMYRL